ncbi:MAG: divalent-cation tolerance protein CutA [Burkholderiales bacterium]
MDDSILLIFSNAPDRNVAESIATALVEARLAACVNILGQCDSVYRWQGRLERACEVPMIIKTTSHNYSAVEAELRRLHPYDVPELLAVPAACGLPDYLDWVRAESAP